MEASNRSVISSQLFLKVFFTKRKSKMKIEKRITLKPTECSMHISSWGKSASFTLTEMDGDAENIVALEMSLPLLRELQAKIDSEVEEYDAKQEEVQNEKETVQ
tara:strand:- start:2226 stop:2537 length:312 start_codon:yes stop_codon:yes gene_type:complete